MREVKVIGVGMTPFGKYPEKSLKDLAGIACREAFKDAGISALDIEAAVVGNAVGGLITGQECIRGQVILRPLGIQGIPVINVESASASGGSALYVSHMMASSGHADVVLALGVEKLYHHDRERVNEALASAMDRQEIETFLGIKKQRANGLNGMADRDNAISQKSIFMDFYASSARRHMEEYGVTQRQLAVISSKNHKMAAMNPLAQYRQPYTVEEVLGSPVISYPLTRLMCSPISDGAAAAVICSAEYAIKHGFKDAVAVAASVEGTGVDLPANSEYLTERLCKTAYEIAGLGPENLDVAEIHDASAFQELLTYEHIGLCEKGGGGVFAEEGHTWLNGRIPVNTSGGLEGRGHPLAATGIAQVYEVVTQLRGRAGKRQVKGAKTAFVNNGGGALGVEPAVMNIHIFTK